MPVRFPAVVPPSTGVRQHGAEHPFLLPEVRSQHQALDISVHFHIPAFILVPPVKAGGRAAAPHRQHPGAGVPAAVAEGGTLENLLSAEFSCVHFWFGAIARTVPCIMVVIILVILCRASLPGQGPDQAMSGHVRLQTRRIRRRLQPDTHLVNHLVGNGASEAR